MTDLALAWAPTAHYRRLATVALLPLLATVVLGRAGYLVLAAPVVAALALGARRPSYGARVSVELSGDRCFEGEDVTVWVRAEPARPAGSVGSRLVLPPGLAVTHGPGARVEGGGGPVDVRWRARARRWGRWDSGQVVVTVRSRGGLFAGTATVSVGEITVFPHPPSLKQLVLPAELRTRIGDHADRRPGEGVEFAGVRPFAAGDRLRRINWAVTSRRGALHVNQLAGERAAEIVAIIDAFTDTGPPGNSTLDRAVRGAAGVARAYTRAGDRVGVVTLYGPMRWIAPGSGARQFFHIMESVMEVRSLFSFVSPDLARIPRTVLPPGALVVMFSPLLDERAVEAAADLRERGYAVVITDVLATSPTPSKGSAVGGAALRVWRLERQALRYRLESLGIPVVGWPRATQRGSPYAGHRCKPRRRAWPLRPPPGPRRRAMSRPNRKGSPWARGVSVSRASLAAAAAGAAMLGVAAGFAPAAWPLVIGGVAAVAAAVLGRWPVAGTLAASAAVVTSGIGITAGTMPLPVAAAEGALILAYLLALDLAESRLTSGTLRWVRSRVQVLAAGFAAAVLTAVAAAATVPGSPWLTMAGVVAVGAALLVAAA